MPQPILDEVRARYGAVAQSSLSSADAGIKSVAESFGYSAAELAAIPAEANMGLSCGNPTAMGSLRPGETVVSSGGQLLKNGDVVSVDNRHSPSMDAHPSTPNEE